LSLSLNGSRVVVTGVAGFIGSHLAETLLELGCTVRGIDCFTDYYSPRIKRYNLRGLLERNGFSFSSNDLLEADLPSTVGECDFLFHLAAQAGVRASWGASFAEYCDRNIRLTQRLLEYLRGRSVKRVVFASSSSVYGGTTGLPFREDQELLPVSPYGVTKLAAENLCRVYWKNFGVPVSIVRYFTVYGPRQRPDMAFARFLRGVLKHREIVVYGDGRQTRDFTYVGDIVRGTIQCAERGRAGEIYNLGSGRPVSILSSLEVIGAVTGARLSLKFLELQKGDATDTLASIQKASEELGYEPGTVLETGIGEQMKWLKHISIKMRDEDFDQTLGVTA